MKLLLPIFKTEEEVNTVILAERLTTGEPIEDIVNAARTALKMPTKGVDGESF